MSTDDLLKILESRSLEVALTRDGMLTLKGNLVAATENLKRVLKLPCHRQEILRRLSGQATIKSVVVVETLAHSAALDPCPKCGKTLDMKARCWARKCGWRKCQGCGGDSGNVFVAHCQPCTVRLGIAGGWND